MAKSILVIGLLCTFLAGGCAAPKLFSYVIYEDPTSFVRLEFSPTARVDERETLHGHPAYLTQEQLSRIFEGLLVKEHRSSILVWFMDEAQEQPAFTEKEVDFLSKHVGRALSLATPEEVVTFYMSTPLNSVTREVTSGLIFVEDERLHFMLSNYRTVYSIPSFGMVYDRRHPAYSLAPRNVVVSFYPPDYVIPNTVGFFEGLVGESHDGEIILDLSRFSALRL